MTPRLGRWLVLVAPLAGVAAVVSATVSRADGSTVAIVSVDDSQFPVVTALFTADSGGRPLTGLTPANIAVTEAGAPADVLSIGSATDARIPLALVIAFDTSGSMAGANLQQSESAANLLVANLAPGDSAALVTFADDVRTAIPLTQNLGLLAPAINGLAANGNTALYDAIGQASQIAATSGVSRRAVVLISDGEDSGGRSKLTRDQSLQAAATGQAIFYVIGIGGESDAAYLQELASRSGGRLFSAANAAGVPAIYNAIAESLRSQYAVTFRSNAPGAARARSLTIAVTAQGTTSSASLQYQSLRGPEPTAVPTAESESAAAAPPPASPEAAKSRNSSSSLVGFAATGAVLVALVLGGFAFWRRRRSRAVLPPPVAETGERALPAPEATRAGTVRATVAAVRGDETVSSITVDSKPITVGPRPECDLVLPAADGRMGVIRLWWRDGRPMAHVIDAAAVTLNGKAFEWAAIAAEDELRIGSYSLRIS
jgi:VWFA-related protein